MENNNSEKLVARGGNFGETHLCDRDYEQHNDFPPERHEYFQTVLNQGRENVQTTVILTRCIH